MARTNVDIDDEACAEIMRRYCFKTKREAINFALQRVAGERAALEGAPALESSGRESDAEVKPLSVEEVRALRGIGWEGDLDEMRRTRVW